MQRLAEVNRENRNSQAKTPSSAHHTQGYANVSLSLKSAGRPPGDAAASDMEAMASLAETYGRGELRVTHTQNIIIPHVRRDHLAALFQDALKAGLAGFKQIFFWEYFHRLWGRLLGVAFVGPLLFLMLTSRIPNGFGGRLFLLLVLGGAQGVIGWWMVKSGLSDDATVSQYRLATHLGMALVIFSLLIWTALDIRHGRAGLPRGLGFGALAAVAVTILAGALVAGMDAGLLYNEYPLMGNGLVPVEYGDEGVMDAFENPASAQFHHRWIAVLAMLTVLAFGLRAVRHYTSRLPGLLAMLMVLVQFGLGITVLLHGVPVSLGGLHQAGAVVLLGLTLWTVHRLPA